jgi:demethylsterigmatocystin 6-O-methyltransferase
MPNLTIQDVHALQSTLNTTIDAYETSPDPDTIAQINKAAKAIAAATRGTSTDFLGLGFQPLENMAIRIAIDLDLFNIIEDDVTLDHLASTTGADPKLLIRILRLLVATKVLDEPKERVYSATPLSHMFRVPPIRDWMKTTFDTLLPIWSSIPTWLRENGYKDITSLTHNPTRTLYSANFFSALAQHPSREADFASAMSLQDAIPAASTAQFPWHEAAATFDEAQSDVFIVDVGGGAGQYLARLINEYPALPGRKILQDLPTVVASVDRSSAPFEPQAHDFFTPQPVKGARYYHLRGVLHDWPDASCHQILRHVKEACAPEYSDILIHTVVLPETGVGRTDAANDLCMWTCCGKERTRREWEVLFAEVGLRIARVVMPEAGFLGYMEVKVA